MKLQELDEERRIGFGVSYGRYCCHGSCRAAPSPCSHLGKTLAHDSRDEFDLLSLSLHVCSQRDGLLGIDVM